MVEGLANAHKLYAPKMIAVSTTCMAEVIGDDLHAFIETSRQKGSIPENYSVPFAHTPAFVGSHVDGYDNMIKGILDHFWKGRTRTPNGKLNIIPGFDGFCVGNNRELKRMLDLMGVEYTLIQDASDQFDTPSDGEFRMYDGGTTLEDAAAAQDAKATISLQHWCTRKTLDFIGEAGQETTSFHYPLGVGATDELLMKVAELSGREIPAALERERGRLVDAMADSQAYLHGKKYAIYGDPDFVYAMARFVLETGGEPTHVLATNGTSAWAEDMQKLLASSPFGTGCQVWQGKDLWHLRSILFTEPVDFLIGQLVRQVSGEGDRHSAHSARLPDLRSPPPPPLPAARLPGRAAPRYYAARQDLRQARRRLQRAGPGRFLRSDAIGERHAAPAHQGGVRRAGVPDQPGEIGGGAQQGLFQALDARRRCRRLRLRRRQDRAAAGDRRRAPRARLARLRRQFLGQSRLGLLGPRSMAHVLHHRSDRTRHRHRPEREEALSRHPRDREPVRAGSGVRL